MVNPTKRFKSDPKPDPKVGESWDVQPDTDDPFPPNKTLYITIIAVKSGWVQWVWGEYKKGQYTRRDRIEDFTNSYVKVDT